MTARVIHPLATTVEEQVLSTSVLTGAVREQVVLPEIGIAHGHNVLPVHAIPTSAGSALRAFISVAARRPGTVGAVWPSSTRLASLLASIVPNSGQPVVVELGPGTGAVSTMIARRLPASGRHSQTSR